VRERTVPLQGDANRLLPWHFGRRQGWWWLFPDGRCPARVSADYAAPGSARQRDGRAVRCLCCARIELFDHRRRERDYRGGRALRRVQHQSVTQASKQAKTSLCRDEHRIRQTPNAPRHADRRPCPQATTSILEERMSRIVLIAISAWVLGVFDARAQTPTPQEHQACSRDASRLCRKQMSEGDYAVQQCLQQHRERLGRACRKAFEEHGM